MSGRKTPASFMVENNWCLFLRFCLPYRFFIMVNSWFLSFLAFIFIFYFHISESIR
jgi:hypothetical protein